MAKHKWIKKSRGKVNWCECINCGCAREENVYIGRWYFLDGKQFRPVRPCDGRFLKKEFTKEQE